MLSSLKTRLRRFVRGRQKAELFPYFLHHHKLGGGMGGGGGSTVRSLNRAPRGIASSLARGLPFCDGTRTLAQAARAGAVSKSCLYGAYEEELALLWPTPIPDALPIAPSAPKSIIISPHRDDAALSMGGRLLQTPRDFLIYNVYTITSWWRFPYTNNDLPAIEAARLAEDQLISRMTGVSMIDLGYQEAPLRGHAIKDIFTTDPSPADMAELRPKLLNTFANLIPKHPEADWYLPFAIGRHIDHRLARDAAMDALRHAGVDNSRIHFYEDLPYAAKGQTTDFRETHPTTAITDEVHEIGAVIDQKIELLRAYWSQLSWGQLPELKTHAASGEKFIERSHTLK